MIPIFSGMVWIIHKMIQSFRGVHKRKRVFRNPIATFTCVTTSFFKAKKFSFSKKDTKIWWNLQVAHFIPTYFYSVRQSNWKISSNFCSFLRNPELYKTFWTHCLLICRKLWNNLTIMYLLSFVHSKMRLQTRVYVYRPTLHKIHLSLDQSIFYK